MLNCAKTKISRVSTERGSGPQLREFPSPRHLEEHPWSGAKGIQLHHPPGEEQNRREGEDQGGSQENGEGYLLLS